MPLTIYQMLWIFVIYAFLGWCTEVVFFAANTGVFVNRGFLNGPACPIYGFGVLVVVLCLTPLRDSLALLFLGSVLLTSLLELGTGLVLEKFFGDKWWDYSDQPFNIKGYICLKFSLLWGIACVFVMGMIQPLIMSFIRWLPEDVGTILLAGSLIVFAADLGITLAAALHLKKRLHMLDEVAEQLKELSSKLGEPLSDGTLEVKSRLEDGKDEIEEFLANFIFLPKAYKFIQTRLLKSFPRLQSGRYKDNLDRLKQLLASRRK